MVDITGDSSGCTHAVCGRPLLIVSAIYLHAVDPLQPGASGFRKFLKGLGMIALLTGVALADRCFVRQS